jgi:hypothetical protein
MKNLGLKKPPTLKDNSLPYLNDSTNKSRNDKPSMEDLLPSRNIISLKKDNTDISFTAANVY